MDNLFKALLIIILVAFLYLYYENSNKDRYFYSEMDAIGPIIFDRKTGTFYYEGGEKGVVMRDYINGVTREYSFRDIKDDR